MSISYIKSIFSLLHYLCLNDLTYFGQCLNMKMIVCFFRKMEIMDMSEQCYSSSEIITIVLVFCVTLERLLYSLMIISANSAIFRIAYCIVCVVAELQSHSKNTH